MKEFELGFNKGSNADGVDDPDDSDGEGDK